MSVVHEDWASASSAFDDIARIVSNKDLAASNEAQTRFDVIDQLIRNVFGWRTGQVSVEEYTDGGDGYIDYILSIGDKKIIIEAKKIGAAFPVSTKKTRLKLSGSILGQGAISKAIKQADQYATDKDADLVCVTTGSCWCFYNTKEKGPDVFATILFPFTQDGHAEKLYKVLAEPNVYSGSIDCVNNTEPILENRLISTIQNADARLDRNNIADYIIPALNHALYASALLSDIDALEKCYITTDGRIKFDNLLGVHLADPKPLLSSPARRIRRSQSGGPLDSLVSRDLDTAPPVTLIIGPVGAGKTTYLKHFEMISGKNILNKQEARWIYIDFEQMGQAGSPRGFLYSKLRDYLIDGISCIDYESVVKPAYEDVISGLIRGPLAPIANNKDEMNKRIADRIHSDYEAIEPYVDKILGYLTKKNLCVIVMDNVDLYDDDELETRVFSEGLALSKRLLCNVVVSLRETTYVNHRNSASFNAYELRKLWLDPPPFRQVLSSRLNYSRKILQGKSAKIPMENGMKLDVPDLGVFFDIVQRSILQGPAGNYIEDIADRDIRYGLNLVNNFLTSGHIQADKALKQYLTDDVSSYYFPFHEVFKGTALGQWKYFKESRSENIINLFDSRSSSKKTRLLRIYILKHLTEMARAESSLEVPVVDCIDLFTSFGASQLEVLENLKLLKDSRLINTSSAKNIETTESVHITRSGAYYIKALSHTFVYAEQCMLDTAIEDQESWDELSRLTYAIDGYQLNISERMKLRNERIKLFMNYLRGLEVEILKEVGDRKHLNVMDEIADAVIADSDKALASTIRHFH